MRAITASPNFWDGASGTGHKHWFFLLKGCHSDEKTRGFYNEQLHPSLNPDRKALEMVGSKVVVEPAADEELSGIGFSSTVRRKLIVEVEGAFRRTVCIQF